MSVLRSIIASAARRIASSTPGSLSATDLAHLPTQLPAISLARIGACFLDQKGYKDMTARKKKNARRINNTSSWHAVKPFLEQQKAGPASSARPPRALPTAIPEIPKVPEPFHYHKIGRITGPFQVTPQPAFAIFELGPYQYRVSPNDMVYNMKLKGVDVNDVVSLDRVLLAGTAAQTMIGRPFLPGASVVAVVEEHLRNAKIEVFKFRRRQGYRKHKGHRAQLTCLRILEIKGLEAVDKASQPQPQPQPKETSSSPQATPPVYA